MFAHSNLLALRLSRRQTKGMRGDFAFRPKLLETMKGYSRNDFFRDTTAGLSVGIVALPLALAFAIACKVEPKAGLYTAIVAGLLISLFGGSRVQIGGPTGAFIPILAGIVVLYGMADLILCTMMAGVILIFLGLARMGTIIKYMPFPVVTGFTSGIAVIIFSTQLKDFLGINIGEAPPHFLEIIQSLARNSSTFQWPTLVLALGSLGIIVAWPKKWARLVPGSVIALIVGTAVVILFHLDQHGIQTIGMRFGEQAIPRGLPPFHWPEITLARFVHLLDPAMRIALLAAIESLLCAIVADAMIDDRHDSNQELIGQGIANIGSALFGGIPATGAIARTATNVRHGARTPVAGIVHAITLLSIVLVAAPVAKSIPLATLSAVLVIVAFNMGEWHHFARLRRWPKSDAAVYLTTFALTVLVDLVWAVIIGIALAAGLFIRRIAESSESTQLDESTSGPDSLAGKTVPQGVMVFRVSGAFFFGAVDKLEIALTRAKMEPDVLILRMKEVLAMDASGLNALEDLEQQLRRKGRHLILSGPHSHPLLMMENDGFIDRLGRENFCGTLEEALFRAEVLLRESSPTSRSGNALPRTDAFTDLSRG